MRRSWEQIAAVVDKSSHAIQKCFNLLTPHRAELLGSYASTYGKSHADPMYTRVGEGGAPRWDSRSERRKKWTHLCVCFLLLIIDNQTLVDIIFP